MGDLDINLIKEFARRPGFYDRGHAQFKDKVYVSKAWNEISNLLGYEVHMLKDRIYQLRNRYNLEKRRLEALRAENPSMTIDSPWPLFNHLTFLDGHIRPRRSYKTMMRRNGSEDPPYYGQSNDNSNIEHPTSSSNNVMLKSSRRQIPVTVINTRLMQARNESARISIRSNSDEILVKNEKDSDASEDDETPEINNTNNFLDPTNYLVSPNNNNNNDVIEINSVSQQNGERRHNLNEENRHEILNEADCVEVINPVAAPTIASRESRLLRVRNIESLKQRDDSHFLPPSKRHRRSRSEKYDAFGKFLAHSFCDLDEDKALMLVEKFTSEVVKALIDNHNKNNSNSLNKELISRE